LRLSKNLKKYFRIKADLFQLIGMVLPKPNRKLRTKPKQPFGAFRLIRFLKKENVCTPENHRKVGFYLPCLTKSLKSDTGKAVKVGCFSYFYVIINPSL